MSNESIKKSQLRLHELNIDLDGMAFSLQMSETSVVQMFKNADGLEVFGRNWAAIMLDYGQEFLFPKLERDLVDVVGRNKERRIAVRCISVNDRVDLEHKTTDEEFSFLVDYTKRVSGPAHAFLFVDFRQFPKLIAWEAPSSSILLGKSLGILTEKSLTPDRLETFRRDLFHISDVVVVDADRTNRGFTIKPDDFSELEKRHEAFENDAA